MNEQEARQVVLASSVPKAYDVPRWFRNGWIMGCAVGVVVGWVFVGTGLADRPVARLVLIIAAALISALATWFHLRLTRYYDELMAELRRQNAP